MSDVVTSKDMDDLWKSLMDLNEVVDGLARRIGNSLGEGEGESHRRWRGQGMQSNQRRGKVILWSSSSSDEDWDLEFEDEQQQCYYDQRHTHKYITTMIIISGFNMNASKVTTMMLGILAICMIVNG